MGEYFKKLIEHYASECSEERMIKLGNVRGAFTDVLIYPKTTDYTNVWNLISGNLIGALEKHLARLSNLAKIFWI